MILPLSIPAPQQALLQRALALLSAIPGVAAVALGGSHARGTARPDSDLDLGIYYRDAAPFEIEAVRRAAEELSGRADQEVTGFYGWGAWVNGGGWVRAPEGKADFLYRSLDQVERTIAEARQGITHHDFDQQPAYGFYSVAYLAETRDNLPLFDPSGALARLKAAVAEYPPRLKATTLAGALWMAEFTLLHADGYADAGDVYAAAGALTRAASFLTQALYALNETYFLSDKAARRELPAFPLLPAGYAQQMGAALAHIGGAPEELRASVARMRALWQGVVDLTGGSYRPAFRV